MLTVIHHTDWDGYAAAYAVQQAVRHGFIPGQTTGTLRFVAANYGDEPPVPLKDSHVIIVDFCYGVDDLKKVKEQALSVIVIDHHLTTPPVCEEAAVKCVFDDTKSGAVLAWEYLFGAAKDVPVFLQYVQDNDLWRFKLPCSKLVRAYLQSMPPSLNEAEIQADRFKGDFEGITREATIVGRIRGRVIDEALKTRHVVELGGHRITAFNAHYFGPEVADTASYILSSPFFAVWVKIGDKYRVSIYKRNEVNDAFKSTIDLSVIAKAYGGGGHANAAGFMCDVLPWNMKITPLTNAAVQEVANRGKEVSEGVMPALTVTPIELRDANDFVSRIHRHHKPVVGHRFSIGLRDESGALRAVAIVGRPVARRLQDGRTVEVTRMCSDGAQNACSMLYRAAWRAAREMGYKRLVTYTLASEPGTSLRAAGFVATAETPGRSWSVPSRPREDKHPLGVKIRWELSRP